MTTGMRWDGGLDSKGYMFVERQSRNSVSRLFRSQHSNKSGEMFLWRSYSCKFAFMPLNDVFIKGTLQADKPI